ncbi:Na(+)/H(+) antiporter subunit B [Rickettsiales bacterium]|nr:Na(+)/H(+) antiporter subunit B [Rickettsiales bacterium]
MNDHVVLRVISRILIPFIFMYGLYIQLHGEYSPGGGFQAGVICASAFILYGIINGLEEVMKVAPLPAIKFLSSFGVLLYAAVGFFAMFKGGNFLNYSAILSDPVAGQKLGIIVIELGVGITVFSVIMLIFYIFGARSS